MHAVEHSKHTQSKRVRFDPETIVRKIMLRRLLSRRSASKTTDNQQESTPISNEVNNNGTNAHVEESKPKVEIIYKVKNSENTADNKLVIEDVAKKDKLVNSEDDKPAKDVISTENADDNEEVSRKKIDENSEEEKEKNDEEKETETEEGESSSESFPESDVQSNAESCFSEFRSDIEEKDSGIEKGESPNLLEQNINESRQETKTRAEDSEEEPEKNHHQDALVSVLKISKLPANTTLQLMSPANTKTRRFVKRGKSARRLAMENSGFDSEQSYDSSPEKRKRGRKNMTVSYLSYPQRYVRSSLAVEARLSQWRKETTSVVEGRDGTARTRMMKRTAQNTITNSILQKNDNLKVPSKNVNFTDSRRLSESSADTSSDEDLKHMSVRKIYSNKKALGRRIDSLEGMLLSMAVQKEALESFVFIMNTWATELSAVERTKLGVPYIRSVKKVLKKQYQSLNSKKSDFGQLVALLSQSKVPCFDDVTTMVKQMNKDITGIVQDKKRYSLRHIEDVRQIQGKIIGTCSAVTAVYYEE